MPKTFGFECNGYLHLNLKYNQLKSLRLARLFQKGVWTVLPIDMEKGLGFLSIKPNSWLALVVGLSTEPNCLSYWSIYQATLHIKPPWVVL